MTMARYRFDLRLCVRSPFLFRGLTTAALGLDASALRDPAGRPLIPGDQIRGVLKEALGDLPETVVPKEGALSIDCLFGRKSAREDEVGAANLPARRRIHFTDLVGVDMVGDPTDKTAPRLGLDGKGAIHTRIALDGESGTVKTGALQVIELVAPMGAAVTFKGTITVFAPRNSGESLTALLRKALALVGSIGGLKSPGFGEVLAQRSSLTLSETSPLAAVAAKDGPSGRKRLSVTFDRPLLVDTERLAANVVAGAAVIPGTVFKGALADRLALGQGAPEDAPDIGGDLGEALSGLSLSHAYPLDKDGRRLCRPLPLSLVAAKGEGDILLGDALDLGDGEGAFLNGHPALFQGDWKPEVFAPALRAAGYPQGSAPPRLARTHTAIDPKTGTAAESMLYTTLLRAVSSPDDTPHFWGLEVDTSGLTGRAAQLAEGLIALMLTDGLDGLGGTGATATFTLQEDSPPAALAEIHGKPGHYALLLETPAVLFHPKEAWPEQGVGKDPRTLYGAYFATHVPGARLKGFFASQRLAGGYIARRRRPYGITGYFPFVLTEAGSIFELEVTDAVGRAALETILARGLPHAPLDGSPPTWRTSPYLPENGYGRVSTTYLSQPAQAQLRGAVTHV
ncbi:RAMP superfamily CRISPR-associated protein [Rhodospirillum rubrum]|uniref:CRISPR type III-associated protein domain-containing protein n=1 Tax=Rhodospirillum rubrum (strain ATCC 11170 / ATH 1.1.1 / DSM 467 / LMG 4362 / NCIMB 8255 / S1) TaxID=269796 RepID=Q2RV94_RHORT|nr:RAMP superfamily CRISPR-associated protein [Rhodospirillum rubrum]ABC21951.1 hypothetical protein Rru_A1150 [Rhodospirillum rubrum ATCC 11170]AEO47656.1 hypothetical protein F11_05930 [Rhodospirillum rubrum F11]MBK5953517.1 hypothetical protein [Rhodospirillum rubrum]QXG81604.1 hypothetical protein KUL73_05985 [Rhodospirillum rubrum]HAQ00712.1 hypothetical protein [Rhodospirillum rubrum]